MSIEVALEDLPAEVERRGPGYLLTTDAASRPHVMHLRFDADADADADGARFTTGVGRSAARNIGAQSAVTLLWPPTEDGGYSLIVDAEAAVAHLEGGATATLTPVSAVLHRPA